MGFSLSKAEIAWVGRLKWGDITLKRAGAAAPGGDSLNYEEITWTVMALDQLGLSKAHRGAIQCDGSVTPAELNELNKALQTAGFQGLKAVTMQVVTPSLGARAFTQGNSIHFGGPAPGQTIMPHEATHVIQQR